MNDFFGDPDEPEEARAEPRKKGDFEKGNQFWRLREYVGRPKAFETGEQLVEEAMKYFDWVEKNPLMLHKVFATGGGLEKKARAMSIPALSTHLGTSESTFKAYKKRDDDLGLAANYVQQVMDAYNIEIACSGLGNGNIIARIIGLSDKVIHGNDPENPLPQIEPVQIYQLPDNGR